MRQPWARRAFVASYSLYKSWIEAGPIDRLKDFVTPGSLVIDVGANIGFFTLKFANWVGSDGQVIAIEPDAENLTTLVQKAKRARLETRIEFCYAAASDKSGFVSFERNELHPGDHRIALGATGATTVTTITLDELALSSERQVSLIKIDVQGAELLVLAGGKHLLRERRPALFVEVDDRALRHYGGSALELISWIEAVGYRIYQLADRGPPRHWPREELLADLKTRGYLDILSLPV